MPQVGIRARDFGLSRDFGTFWAGQTLSVLGSSISVLAVPLLVLAATGSVLQMGLITAISGIGTVVAGLFAGHLVDRGDRLRIMIGTDLVRAGLHLLVPVLWLAGPQVWLLYLLAAITSCLSMVFDIAYVTAVANLVDPDQVTVANGRLTATFSIGSMIGQPLAGVLAATVGAAWALGADGLTFLISASSIYLIRFRPAPEPVSGADSPGLVTPAPIRDTLTVGVCFLWQHPVLRALTILLALFIFVTAGATDILIFHLRHDLRVGTGAVGYVMGSSGLGALVGAMLTARLRRAYGFGACWLGSVLLVGAAITVAGRSGNVVVIAVAAALFAFGTAVAGICSMSLRQEVTPDHLLGRVTSAFWTLHMAPGPVGAAAFTALAARTGTSVACLCSGGFGCLLIAGLGMCSPIRTAGALTYSSL